MKRIVTALALLVGLAAFVPVVSGPIVYLTDFGTRDGAVAAMKGVAARVDPTLPQHDLTHAIQPFDIWEGAYRLAQAAPFWPSNTVFVCVVDPGVGTQRKPVVHRTRSGHLFVGPDNGLFTMVDDALGHDRSFVIDTSRHRIPGSDASHTFHGRDLFAHVGARLASGTMSPADSGVPAAGEPVRLPCPKPTLSNGVVSGIIPVLDVQYGNVWSNVGTNLVAEAGFRPGDILDVVFRKSGRRVARLRAPFVHTFGDVPEGKPLVFLNSLLQMSVALNTGDLAARHRIGSGPDWSVEFRLAPRKHPFQDPASR